MREQLRASITEIVTFTSDGPPLVGEPLQDVHEREVGTITAVEFVPGGVRVTAKLRDDIQVPVTVRVPSGISICGAVRQCHTAE